MPVVSRVYWKGFLRLSLVTINVEVYSAVDSGADISFRQIHKPSGKRIKYEKVVPGIGAIESSDIVKGYEVDNDSYVLIEPDEIKALKLESERALDLVQFVDADEIDARYFERPYYVRPADEPSTDGFMVIAEALKKSGKVGLGQVTMRGREYLVAISPILEGKGLLMEVLRYDREVREAKPFFDDLPVKDLDTEMVDLASELIERKAAPFDAGAFEDRYAVALKALVEKKAKGAKVVAKTDDDVPRSAEVVDLMEALKKSVSAKATGKGGKSATRGNTKKPASDSATSPSSGRKGSSSRKSAG